MIDRRPLEDGTPQGKWTTLRTVPTFLECLFSPNQPSLQGLFENQFAAINQIYLKLPAWVQIRNHFSIVYGTIMVWQTLLSKICLTSFTGN